MRAGPRRRRRRPQHPEQGELQWALYFFVLFCFFIDIQCLCCFLTTHAADDHGTVEFLIITVLVLLINVAFIIFTHMYLPS